MITNSFLQSLKLRITKVRLKCFNLVEMASFIDAIASIFSTFYHSKKVCQNRVSWKSDVFTFNFID